MAQSFVTVTEYTGGNEYIDHLIDEQWFIVNGSNGRRPIQAGSEEEALAIYNAKPERKYGPQNVPQS